MATDVSVKSKHPRNFTAEERRERFLASAAKALAGKPIPLAAISTPKEMVGTRRLELLTSTVSRLALDWPAIDS